MDEKWDRFTVEEKQDYLTEPFVVYGWSTYPRGSVLEGQPQKAFIDAFETRDAALQAYPGASPGSKWTDPQVSLSHLPGEDDMVPGGAYPDDYDL